MCRIEDIIDSKCILLSDWVIIIEFFENTFPLIRDSYCNDKSKSFIILNCESWESILVGYQSYNIKMLESLNWKVDHNYNFLTMEWMTIMRYTFFVISDIVVILGITISHYWKVLLFILYNFIYSILNSSDLLSIMV